LRASGGCRYLIGAAVSLGVVASAPFCRAETMIQVLAIGNNQGSPEEDPGAAHFAPARLQFADDDAAAFFELLRARADEAHLLTVMDRDTEALYPELAAQARPPSLGELRRAVDSLATHMEQRRREGHTNVLFLYFSGHGEVVAGKSPALALLDGGISQQLLYEEILQRLPADYVHLLVDACHAEAIVRPRDLESEPVEVSPAEAQKFLVHSTLARFPHVGAIVAAASDSKAHEWDLLGHGVFTYELLSALRGGADVNHDGRIEYSEAFAFLTAASRAISDPRARLSIIAQAPPIDRRIPLLDLSRLAGAEVVRLEGIPSQAGLVEVEDEQGRRLASVHGERGFSTDLVVPAGRGLFVRAHQQEARVARGHAAIVPFGDLRFRPPGARARGAMEESMRLGLFAAAFGPAYYSGFVDRSEGFVPVPMANENGVPAAPIETVSTRSPAPPSVHSGYAAIVGVGMSSTLTPTISGGAAALRIGLRPNERRGLFASLDLARAVRAPLVEWQSTATVGWLESRRLGIVTGWAGIAAGGGVVAQDVDARGSHMSGLLSAGPDLGVRVDLPVAWRRIGLLCEGQLAAVAYRRESRVTSALSRSVWLAASLAF